MDIPNDVKIRVIKFLRNGWTISDVAKTFGLKERTVRRIDESAREKEIESV